MKYAISLSTIFISALVALVGLSFLSAQASDPFVSVELGISELSPAGEAGGRAMPASGASVELSYRQNGTGSWETDSPAILPNDDPVDLQWNEVVGSGGARIDYCNFTAGYQAPLGQQLSNDVSVGSSLGRILSEAGNSSTYTIVCTDRHTGTGHNAIPYTDSDSVLLMLETECNDGVDNSDSEDTLVDANDPGCHTDGDPNDGDVTYDPLDDDERDSSPSMTLEGCAGSDCVSSGETLTIDEFDSVIVSWTSENTDSCEPLGTFNMTGNPTSGSDGVVEPDSGESTTYSVACTYSVNGGGILVRSVIVRNPAIRLIPYPNPPIVPANGMPPSDPATVEPIIEGYLPELCTLEGQGVNDTIANITTAGDLTDGTYEVTLNTQGETTYVLECVGDTDGDGIGDTDPVTDAATFRILPVIQET